MISYSQNFEDVMLNRVFRDRKSGFYVDVGAADPTNLSVTKWFYDNRWSGINIEPHPEFYQKLVAERPRDINLNCGAGAVRSDATFFQLPTMEWSSFDVDSRARAIARGEPIVETIVPILPLNEILDSYSANRTIDFLKIDVEGWEHEVLSGIDLTRYRPTVIVIEATLQGTQDLVFSSFEDILTSANFKAVYFDGLNKFYLPNEQIALSKYFATPPNAFDKFIRVEDVRLAENIEFLSRQLAESEADRLARSKQIEILSRQLAESEADRLARSKQIEILSRQLAESEADRLARFEQIQILTKTCLESEAQRTAQHKQLQTLSESLTEAGTARTALVERVQTLSKSLTEAETARVVLADQVQTLTNSLAAKNAQILEFESIFAIRVLRWASRRWKRIFFTNSSNPNI